MGRTGGPVANGTVILCAPAASTDSTTGTPAVQEGHWRRTRFHFAGEFGMPSENLGRSVRSPAFGGAFAVEFASRSRLRPVLDLSYLYASGTGRSGIRQPDVQHHVSHMGLRWFTDRRMTGLHLDMLWGVDLAVVEYPIDPWSGHGKRVVAHPAMSVAAGLGAMVGPVAISLRYQVLPDHDPWIYPMRWNGHHGFTVFRMGFVLGGGLRAFSEVPHGGSGRALPAAGSSGKGSTRSQLAWQAARADSLEREAAAREATNRELQEQQVRLQEQIDRQKGMIEQAEAEKEALLSQPSVPPAGLRYKVLDEAPHRFNAIAVYTVLHSFSDPLLLDTFRVVTTSPPGGGYKHELRISTTGGKRYKEELYALPLHGTTPGTAHDEERELLRVRMALAPGAFIVEPVTISAWERSEAREVRDLAYQLSHEQFNTVLQDRPEVGFRFQSDEHTTKVLVHSRTLDRIVNIEPE